MLTNFFSKSKPITILIVFAIFLVLLILSFFNGKTQGTFIELFTFFSIVLSIVIFIDTKNNLSYSNSYVLLVFVLLIAIFTTLKINSVFYANVALLLFFRKIYSLQSPTGTYKKLFDSGLFLAISFLIEPFFLTFGLLLYLSIFLNKHLTIPTIIIPLTGFFVPLFLFLTYCFWFDKTDLFLNLFDLSINNNLSLYFQYKYLVPICIICLTILISILIKTPKALAVKNDFRKSWILILFNLVFAIVVLFNIKNKDGSELICVFFPVAIIIANLIEIYEKEWFSSVFIALLISLAITMSVV